MNSVLFELGITMNTSFLFENIIKSLLDKLEKLLGSLNWGDVIVIARSVDGFNGKTDSIISFQFKQIRDDLTGSGWQFNGTINELFKWRVDIIMEERSKEGGFSQSRLTYSTIEKFGTKAFEEPATIRENLRIFLLDLLEEIDYKFA